MTILQKISIAWLVIAAGCRDSKRVDTAPPEPEPAKAAILHAFLDHRVVAVADVDQLEQNHAFIASVIGDTTFVLRAGNIVVEWGNARYQNILDRYLAGDSVARSELQQIWRNTAGGIGPAWEAPIYEGFFRTVRAINRGRSDARRLRVWLGDPPIDWSTVRSPCDVIDWVARRDSNIARLVRERVIARGGRTLLVAGSRHVLRGLTRPDEDEGLNAVALLERQNNERVFVVLPHRGFVRVADSLEQRLGTWSAPALARLEGTWLGAVDAQVAFPPGRVISVNIDGKIEKDPFEHLQLADLADAYLYLGPSLLLRRSRMPNEVLADSTFMAELERRDRIAGLDARMQGRTPACWLERQRQRK